MRWVLKWINTFLRYFEKLTVFSAVHCIKGQQLKYFKSFCIVLHFQVEKNNLFGEKLQSGFTSELQLQAYWQCVKISKDNAHKKWIKKFTAKWISENNANSTWKQRSVNKNLKRTLPRATNAVRAITLFTRLSRTSHYCASCYYFYLGRIDIDYSMH